MTNRHRLNRGGHRQANAAFNRAVIVRMQHHEPNRTYVVRPTTEGKTKAETACTQVRRTCRQPTSKPCTNAPIPASPRRHPNPIAATKPWRFTDVKGPNAARTRYPRWRPAPVTSTPSR